MKLQFTRIEDFRDEEGWRIVLWFDMINDEGVAYSQYRYSMPPSIFEHRIAEYGQMSKDELVEMVIAEGAMILGVGETNDGLTTLATAPDQKTARKHHLARCARVKLKWRISTRSGPASAMEELKKKITLRPEGIREKRNAVMRNYGLAPDWEDQ